MDESQMIEQTIEIAKSNARLEAYNAVFKKLIETLQNTISRTAKLALIEVGDYIVELSEKERK